MLRCQFRRCLLVYVVGALFALAISGCSSNSEEAEEATTTPRPSLQGTAALMTTSPPTTSFSPNFLLVPSTSDTPSTAPSSPSPTSPPSTTTPEPLNLVTQATILAGASDVEEAVALFRSAEAKAEEAGSLANKTSLVDALSRKNAELRIVAEKDVDTRVLQDVQEVGALLVEVKRATVNASTPLDLSKIDDFEAVDLEAALSMQKAREESRKLSALAEVTELWPAEAASRAEGAREGVEDLAKVSGLLDRITGREYEEILEAMKVDVQDLRTSLEAAAGKWDEVETDLQLGDEMISELAALLKLAVENN